MDEGFSSYTVRVEGFSSKVEKLVTHFAGACDDKSSAAAAKFVTYIETLRAGVKSF